MTAVVSLSSFIVGVALGAFLAGGWMAADVYSFFAPEPPSEELKPSLYAPKSGAVEISTQAAGSSVRIDAITIPPPGVWVAVRETAGEELGNVLGAARVSGPQTNFDVSLLRDTLPGKTYVIELYRDDNAGAFDPAANSVYVDFDTGARVVERFMTEE